MATSKFCLQARNTIDIVRGGYKNEEHHPVGEYFKDWTDVGLEVDDLTTTVVRGVSSPGYLYRDSDVATNARSTAVTVTIEDHWTAVRSLTDNSVIITVDTYLKGIKRHDVKGTPPPARRTLAAYRFYDGNKTDYRGVQRVWGDYQDDKAHTAHLIKTDKTFVGTRVYTLKPGQKTSDVTDPGTVYFWNHVTGHAYDQEIWLDCMYMGLEFKNTLPTSYPAPTLTSITQGPDLCKYRVTVDLAFRHNLPPNSGNHRWFLEISLDADFADAEVYTIVTPNTNFVFKDIERKPNQKYYWRISLDSSEPYSINEQPVGEFRTLEIINPSEAAPKFTEHDCDLLTGSFPPDYDVWPNWRHDDDNVYRGEA